MSLGIVKPIIEVAVSLGVSTVVGNAVKATTPDNIKIASKILVGIGSFAASNAIADLASRYVVQQVEEGVNEVKKVMSKSDKNEK